MGYQELGETWLVSREARQLGSQARLASRGGLGGRAEPASRAELPILGGLAGLASRAELPNLAGLAGLASRAGLAGLAGRRRT
jgi:hypothetical protein